MKTKFFLSTLVFIAISTVGAQGPTFEWAKHMGGSTTDIGYSITTDTDGNIYVTGIFSGTADLNPGTGTANYTSNGLNDIFIQKLDSNGNLLWVKTMGSIYEDYAFSILVDSNGNIYTIGAFPESVDFDPNSGTTLLTSAGSFDIFIQKLDTNGNLLWVKQLGNTHTDYGYSLAMDTNGDLFATGFFRGTVDFNPGSGSQNLTSFGESDIFLLKLDTNGNFIWVKQMGGSASDYGRSITTDGNNNIYMTGNFEGTVDFDPGTNVYNLTSAGDDDSFVLKLDPNGNLLWARQIGGSIEERGESISVDAQGNVYSTGTFMTTVDFNPGSGTNNFTAAGGTDVYVQKLDTNGNFVWANYMGGLGGDYSNSITTDTNGNAYVIGSFFNTANFDSGLGTTSLTSFGGYDIFIQKFDSAGHIDWVKQMGGTNYEFGYFITVETDGNIYSTGTFSGVVDFNPGTEVNDLTSIGGYDFFIQKLSEETAGLVENPFVKGVKVFPNPTKGKLTIAFEQKHKKISIKVLTTTGQELMFNNFTNTDSVQLELHQPAGTYILEITNEHSNTAVLKMIKD